MSEQIKPVAWWNGLRKEDYEDLTGPSISWNGETDSHDIPLFAGFNEASETVQQLQRENADLKTLWEQRGESIEQLRAELAAAKQQLAEAQEKAEWFDWLDTGKRAGWIWDHALTDDEKEGCFNISSAAAKAIDAALTAQAYIDSQNEVNKS